MRPEQSARLISLAALVGFALSPSAYALKSDDTPSKSNKQGADKKNDKAVIPANVKLLPETTTTLSNKNPVAQKVQPQYTQRFLSARVAQLRREQENQNAETSSQNAETAKPLVLAQANLPPAETIIGRQNNPDVVLSRVEFLGNSVFDDATLEAIAKPYIGHPIDAVVDVEKLREAVTLKYVSAGYVNSGAVIDNPNVLGLPSGQNPDDPTTPKKNEPVILRIGVVEGRVSETKIAGLENLRESYIKDRLLPDKDEVLNLGVLQERFQLLLQDPLFKKIQSRVLPTNERGGAVLDLQVERNPAWSGFVGFNNNRSPSSGENQFSTGVTFRNLSTFGDTLNLSASAPQKGASNTNSYSASFSVPLPPFQTQIALGYDKGQTLISEAPFTQLFSNDNNSQWVSITQSFVNNINHVFSADLSHFARKSQNFIDNEKETLTLGEDNGFTRNVVNRLGVSYTYRQPEFAWANRLTYSKGHHNYSIDERLRGVTAIPENDYSHLIFQTLLNYKLTEGGQILGLRVNWQETKDSLIGMERFSLTSSNAVRGYIESSYSFDKVRTASLEWQIPLYRSVDGWIVSATPFYDWGVGSNTFESVGSDTSLTLSSAGLSLSAQLSKFSMRLDYAKALKNKEIIKDGYLQSKGISFSLRYDF